jgi:hypothetical protein
MAAVTLLALAAWLRFAGFAGRPLWLDEAYSAYAAGKGWAFLWQMVPRYETHPPFYYSLVRLWTLPFGDSLIGLRMLGLACGMATLPLGMLCAREIGHALGLGRIARSWFQIAALALLALSPMLVLMAREVRPYPVLILVYLAGIHALLRMQRHIAEGGRIASPAYAAYLAALALTLWLHNLGPLFGASLGLGFLAVAMRPQAMQRRDWLWFLGGHALVALAYLPALMILIDQAPTWIRSTWLRFDPALAGWRVATLLAGGRGPVIGAALLLLLLGVGALARTEEGRRIAILLLVTAILPVVASLTVSALVAPVFIMRTMTPVVAHRIVEGQRAFVGIGVDDIAALRGGRERARRLAAMDRHRRARLFRVAARARRPEHPARPADAELVRRGALARTALRTRRYRLRLSQRRRAALRLCGARPEAPPAEPAGADGGAVDRRRRMEPDREPGGGVAPARAVACDRGGCRQRAHRLAVASWRQCL